jgi:hypothetical protein
MKLSKRQFTIGLLAVFIFAVTLYIVLESPLFMRGRVAAIKVGGGWTDYFFVTSNQFTCIEDAGGTQTDCSLNLEGETLQAAITHSPGGSIFSCTATYAGKTVGCDGQYTIMNSPHLGIAIDDSLGISPERMAELRAQHPLLYWQESTWLTITNILAVAAIVLILVSLWIFRPQRPTFRLMRQMVKSGAVVLLGGLMWYASLWGLIILGYVD